MSLRRPAVVCVALFALVGCSQPAPALGTSAESAIMGGVSAAEYPEAALIDMGDAACSGAVIAPRIVLTAGHCVVGRSSFIVTAPFSGQGAVRASSAEAPDYDDQGETVNPDQHDVALIYLDEPILLTRYPTIATRPLTDGSAVVNIGRIGDGQISFDSLFVGAPVAVSDGAAVGFPNAYSTDEVIESGDSGGPCEVDGSDHEIAAVNSGAGGGIQLLARVDLAARWIKQRVAAYGGR